MTAEDRHHIQKLQSTIEELQQLAKGFRQDRDHWREANRASLAAGELLKEELSSLRGDIFNICNGDKLLEGADNNACILESFIERLTARIALLEGENIHFHEWRNQLVEEKATLEAEIEEASEACPARRMDRFANANLLALVNEQVSQLFRMQSRAEQAERERDHEALRYEGMRADRDDWRQRNEQAEATTRRLEAEVESLKTDVAFKDSLIWEMRTNNTHAELVKQEKEIKRLREALEKARPYVVERVNRGNAGFTGEVDSVLALIDAALAATPEGQPDYMKTNVPNGLNTNPGDENY